MKWTLLSFAVVPAASTCTQPTVSNAPNPQSCTQATVNSGDTCTPRCDANYYPDGGDRQCTGTPATIATWNCVPYCSVPTSISGAASSNPCGTSLITSAQAPGANNPGLNQLDSTHSCVPACAQHHTLASSGQHLQCSAAGGTISFTCNGYCDVPTADSANHYHSTAPCGTSGLVQNSAGVASMGVPVNSPCHAQCAPGYSFSGSNPTCATAGDSISFTCAPSTCVQPTVTNAPSPTSSHSCTESSVVTGGDCTPRCDANYYPDGGVRTCSVANGASTATIASWNCVGYCAVPTHASITGSATSNLCGTSLISASAHGNGANQLALRTSCVPACDTNYFVDPNGQHLSCTNAGDTISFTCTGYCAVPPADSTNHYDTSAPCGTSGLVHNNQGVAVHSQCHAQCAPGYALSGSSPTCQSAGGSLSFTCAAQTCTQPSVTHAPSPTTSHSCTQSSVVTGGTCTTQCDPGYTPSVNSVTCSVPNGGTTQTITPWTCDADTCTQPTVANAPTPQSCAESTVRTGGTCTARCNPGYTASAHAPVPCQVPAGSSTQSIAPWTCTANLCTQPTVTHAPTPQSCQETAVHTGQTCTARCDTGYYPSVASVTCSVPQGGTTQTIQAWTCTGYCAVPAAGTIPHMASSPCGTNVLAAPAVAPGLGNIRETGTCDATCEANYYPDSTGSHLSCSAAGASISFSCLGYCAVPAATAANHYATTPCGSSALVNSGAGIATSTQCHAQCAPGYSTSATPLCSTPGDSLSFTCAANTCTQPTVANAPSAPSSHSCLEASVVTGGTCTTQCNPGYTASVSSVTCSVHNGGTTGTIDAWTCTPASTTTTAAPSSSNLPLILGIIGALGLLAGVAAFLLSSNSPPKKRAVTPKKVKPAPPPPEPKQEPLVPTQATPMPQMLMRSVVMPQTYTAMPTTAVPRVATAVPQVASAVPQGTVRPVYSGVYGS